MTPGRLIAVVGPSGVGKDSVMAGIIAAAPQIGRIRRTITRAPGLGGEDYDAVSAETFARMVDKGAFCLHWTAHGLSYGLPMEILDAVRAGEARLGNLSRGALADAAAVFPQLLVLNITATPATLARRLAVRGRETESDIAARLAQADRPLPDGLQVVCLGNDGALADTVARAMAALQPVKV